jgi:rhodanese-related sulfurtransferase
MPANTIPDNIGSIPLSKDIGIFCSGGVRAGIVYAYLKALGYNCWIIEGGFDSVLEVVKPGFVFKNTK